MSKNYFIIDASIHGSIVSLRGEHISDMKIALEQISAWIQIGPEFADWPAAQSYRAQIQRALAPFREAAAAQREPDGDERSV